MKLSLRNQFLIPTLFLLIAGMGIMIAISFGHSKNAIEKMAAEQVRQLAVFSSDRIESWINGVQVNIDSWSREILFKTAVKDSYLGESARENAIKKLTVIKKDYKFFENLVLVNKKGDAIASNMPELIGKLNIADRPYFQECLKGKSVISDVLTSRVSGEPLVIFSSPVKQYDETVEGVLTFTVNMDTLARMFINPVKSGQNGYAYMCNAEGLIIAHPQKEQMMQDHIKNYGITQEMIKSNELIKYLKNGNEVKAAFHQVGINGWLFAVVSNSSELMAPVNKLRNINIIVSLSITAFVGIIIFFIAQKVTLPLGAEPHVLSEVAQKIALGDLEYDFSSQDKKITGVFYNIRQMSESIKAKAFFAETIAKGDLTKDISLSSEKDLLGKSLKKMTENLRGILAQVNQSGKAVEIGTEQINSSSQLLAQGASEQAGSLEQITSSMIQIGAQIRTNADNASQASSLAAQSRQMAEKGKDEMGNMISAMENISESSKAIAKIIKVIDEIAFQTNLLALNAAVEAARAGRYGKGFAVVAEEVRNLAGRSAKAAKETAELIEGAVKKVEHGNNIASQTADALNNILFSAVKTAELVGEIAAASSEQANGVEQINQGLTQVDQVTQTIAASADEMANASNRVSAQSVTLNQMISQFKLKDTSSHDLKLNADIKHQDLEKKSLKKDIEDQKNAGKSQTRNLKPEEIIPLNDDEFETYD
ncbi:Methyl-accepting chemotaxis protein domain-containing protein, double CACHE domain-containing [Desulfonema limicola]|uniref:Methyl-accepting chemotaxis protein domain-containing protein, double CACHE domain-containing n=1 Tax=Desulfonema limicola TaxID=45656 RepID=A0A975B945_9BACT|nr:methyl-accepting chemotaxis protein [Desulfonema limicola]QTA81112.1 Methyl-accepting chemotaxis protein domain-containing protein, double CACHE domain-containing [Desulfonema limicola]